MNSFIFTCLELNGSVCVDLCRVIINSSNDCPVNDEFIDAISKDPREELRMLGSNSSFIGQSLEEFITTLHKSTRTEPFNSRHVKMNEFKTKTIQYCNHFQEGKCRFGEKYRYEHKINPDYRKKEVYNDEKKKSNHIIPSKNNNKFQ